MDIVSVCMKYLSMMTYPNIILSIFENIVQLWNSFRCMSIITCEIIDYCFRIIQLLQSHPEGVKLH